MNFTDVTEAYLSTMPPPDEFVRESMESHQSSMEEARELYLMHTEPEFRVYEGDAHRVTVWPVGGELGHLFVRLSIQNTDGSARHDWRELQQIKHEVVGQENEAIELYPAESRKRDYGNAFHLFVAKSPEYRFPFGAMDRRVSNRPPTGYAQRPLPDYDPESLEPAASAGGDEG